MISNPKLAKRVGGAQTVPFFGWGQRQWNDHMPNGDFSEALLNSSFDWNGIRQAFVVATENDSLNGVAMLFGHLLSNTAQVFADVRTYWSPEAVKRVTGKTLTGVAKNGMIHLINSGSASLDGSGQMTKDGNSAMKPYWEITKAEVKKCLDALRYPASRDISGEAAIPPTFLPKGECRLPCRASI
jgi:L-fucose isomerase